MPLLFAVTMFVSATLLFLVEPMVGKMILPLLGGTPAVWNTCMVFFQALLLAGYFYSHRLTSDKAPKSQITVHMGILGCAIAVLGIAALLAENHSPIPIVKSISPQGDQYPFFGVIVLLTVAIGLPFFVLCTSAPLLQKWFAETGHPSAKDPYFLYGASNFGSLLALIAYPSIVEPNLKLVHQAYLFAIGYGVLLVLIIYCANAVKNPIVHLKKGGNVAPSVMDPPPTISQKLRWLLLAAVPSSLMLGVTTYISTDMASIPLLWIVPLSLYLITFILVFSNWGRHLFKPFYPVVADVSTAFGGSMEKEKDDHIFYVLLAPVLILLVAFLLTSRVPAKFGWQLLLHFANFFVVTMLCHGELVRTRPSTRYLTSFYLIMSLGGMVGGMFNALAAPIIFDFISEYPITLVLACFLLPSMFPDAKKSTWAPWLDALVPLLVFTLCRILQSNEIDIRDFLFDHGREILTGTLLFILPAVAVVANAYRMAYNVSSADAHARKQLFYARIWLAAVLVIAGIGYMLMWFPERWLHLKWQGGPEGSVGEQTNSIQGPIFTPLDMIRFLPAILGLIAYWSYYRSRIGRLLMFQHLATVFGAIVVGLGAMILVGDKVMNNISPWGDSMSHRDTVMQIVIYGLPAMLCYLFVERPIRFGGAVAALWLATYLSEMKTGYNQGFLSFSGKSGLAVEMYRQCDAPPGSLDTFYTRTFFGRLKISRGDIYNQTVQLVHGTTVHGLQNRYGDAHSIKVFANALAPVNPMTSAINVAVISDLPEWQFPGREPLTYYHRIGPIGSMFEAFYDHLKKDPSANSAVACIGLGTGSLSSYGLNTQMMKRFGREGQKHRMTFFEIDATVRGLVEPPRFFTYVDKAKKQGVELDFEMGDARITMERVNRKFGMMLIDAFSSDAIPAHLLTKEAVELYFSKLEENGLLAIHISNRFMKLEPVVERIAKELQVEARVMHGSSDPWDEIYRVFNGQAGVSRTPNSWMVDFVDGTTKVPTAGAGRSASTWIALARKKEYLGPIEAATERWLKSIPQGKFVSEEGVTYTLNSKDPTRYISPKDGGSYSIRDHWMTLTGDPKVGLWTDDYYSIYSVLMGEWKFWAAD